MGIDHSCWNCTDCWAPNRAAKTTTITRSNNNNNKQQQQQQCIDWRTTCHSHPKASKSLFLNSVQVPTFFSCQDGSKFPFQTTVKAAGGNILEAERVARLCWEMLHGGKSSSVSSWTTEIWEIWSEMNHGTYWILWDSGTGMGCHVFHAATCFWVASFTDSVQ